MGGDRTCWQDYVFQLLWELLGVLPQELEEVARWKNPVVIAQTKLGKRKQVNWKKWHFLRSPRKDSMGGFFLQQRICLPLSVHSFLLCNAHATSSSLFVVNVCEHIVVSSAILSSHSVCCLTSIVCVFHAVSILLSSIYPFRKWWDLDLSSSPYLVNPGRLSPNFSNQDPFSSVCVSSNLPASFSVCGGILREDSWDRWLPVQSFNHGTIHSYIRNCRNIPSWSQRCSVFLCLSLSVYTFLLWVFSGSISGSGARTNCPETNLSHFSTLHWRRQLDRIKLLLVISFSSDNTSICSQLTTADYH